MDGIGGLRGWQWIFCIEGMVTVVVAFIAYFRMHDYPSTARFLTDNEKKAVIGMLKEDSQGLSTHYDKKFVFQAMTDYKTYVQVGIYIGIVVPVYAIALFSPTIVNEMGFTAAAAQLLQVPIFVAGCIATITVGIMSDKHNLRGPYVIGSALVSIIGYIVLYTQTKPGAAYIGAVIAAMGVYPIIAVALAWVGSATGGDVRKGVVLAMVIGLGNFGGVCSSFIYITPPRFHIGHGTAMGWLGSSIVLSCFAMWDYNRINKQKITQCEEEKIDSSRQDEFKDMGNESPLFRYTL